MGVKDVVLFLFSILLLLIFFDFKLLDLRIDDWAKKVIFTWGQHAIDCDVIKIKGKQSQKNLFLIENGGKVAPELEKRSEHVLPFKKGAYHL